MDQSNIDLILHPARMRIIMALAGKELTAHQLQEALPDIPQATLYRHIRRLAGAGVMDVAEERPVRGTLEKLYRLNQQAVQMGPEQAAATTKEDHLRFFTAFIATLLDDFARYLQRKDKIDFLADGIGYRKIPLELSDEEFMGMAKELNQVVKKYVTNDPVAGRRRRIFASISILED